MSVINNVLKDLETRESQFTPIEIPSIDQGKSVERSQNPLMIGAMPLLALLGLFVAGGYYWQNQFDFSVAQLSPMSDETEKPQAAIAPLALVVAAPLPANEIVPAQHTTERAPAAIASLPSVETAPLPANEIVPTQHTTEHAQAAIASLPSGESAPLSAIEITPAQQTPGQPAALKVVADTPPLPGNQIVGLQIREGETEMRLEFVLRERAAAYLKERAENSFSYHLRNIENQIVTPLIRDNRWIRKLTIVPVEGGVDVNFATAPGILVETRQKQQPGESVWAIYLREAKPAAPLSAAHKETSQPDALQAVPIVDAPAVQAEPEPTVKVNIKSTNPVTQTTNQLDYAVQLMNSSRSDDAESLLRSLFGGTHDYSARKHLLALYSRLNRPARLRALLQASLLEYPQDPFFTTEYARALFAATAYREVISLLDSTTRLDADQQALLAASYQRLDEHEAAIHHYQLALQQDSQNARNWVGLGISQEQNAAFGAALDAYQEASRLGSLNSRLQAFVKRRGEQLRKVLN